MHNFPFISEEPDRTDLLRILNEAKRVSRGKMQTVVVVVVVFTALRLFSGRTERGLSQYLNHNSCESLPEAVYHFLVCILSPLNDNCSS